MPDSLVINWPYLLIAVAVLWFPRQWLRTGKAMLKRRRKPDGALERLAGMGARDPEDRSVQPSKEFTNFRNYLDLLRGLAGGYCLTQVAFDGSGEGAGFKILMIEAIVLLVATLVQVVRMDGRLSFYAAIFFLVGINVGSLAHYAALFAFALVLAINPIIPNPRLFLTAYGLLMLPFGIFFGADFDLLLLNSGFALLAPMLSLLTKRPVVIFSRKSKSQSAT